MRRLAQSPGSGWALLAALLILWQVSAVYWTESPNWPPLVAVAGSLVRGLASGELLQVFGSSLYLMASGYAIGVACALVTGLAMASVRVIRAALEPLVELLRPIPIPAIVPPLILLLGVDDALKIFVIAFSVFFPVLVNTVSGVRAIDPVAIDGAWRRHAPRAQGAATGRDGEAPHRHRGGRPCSCRRAGPLRRRPG